MSMPPAIVNWLITAQYLFMSKEKEIFQAMQAKLEDQSTKYGSGSASKPFSQDPPFKTPQPKQRMKGTSPGEAETRPRKRKKEEATGHSRARAGKGNHVSQTERRRLAVSDIL